MSNWMNFIKLISKATLLLLAVNTARCKKNDEHEPKHFEVYQYLPFTQYVENGKTISFTNAHTTVNDWFLSYGVKMAKVVYNPYDDSERKRYAQATPSSSIISLDVERWDFFKDDTPDNILQVVVAMKNLSPMAPVGLYGVVPVNTFGWHADTKQKYDALNPRYQAVADAVDVLSPSLYSYQPDMQDWIKGATYNIEAARAYKTGKRIIPYISLFVRDGAQEREKTYDEMKQQLSTLESLGADGCLIWGSSAECSYPLDPQTGWLRAVIEFVESHS